MTINTLMTSSLRRLGTVLRQDFLPSHCLLCNSPCGLPQLLCNSCNDGIRPNLWPCPVCASAQCALTRHCGKPRTLRRARAGLVYGGVVRELIHRWKFAGAADLTGLLAQRALETAPLRPRFDALVPVPMHWRRRWYRGYNQSDLLARVVSQVVYQQSGVRVPVRNLVRAHGGSRPQHRMNRLERRHNVRNRYSTKADLAGRSLLIVDDVITTGTTLGAVASCLAEAGARRVEAWCLARAP